jgi:hypothetical protein
MKKTTKLSHSQRIKRPTTTKLPQPFVKIGANPHNTATGRARDPIHRICRSIKKKPLK